MSSDFDTSQVNTWCPGCLNNVVLRSVKKTLTALAESGVNKRNLVAVADIGCAGKFYDYLNVNGFYALHGRALPTAFGIKMANPELKVLAFLGDGGAYAEGLNHLVHLARLNPDLTALVLNNRIFALTIGQVTPVTEKGYRGSTTPEGSVDSPYNPLSVALSAQASFIARVSPLDPASMEAVITKAINHKGFSLVEVIQPCITFRLSDLQRLKEKCYSVAGHQEGDYLKAREVIESWNYENGRIPLGIFYRVNRPTWEERHQVRNWFRLKRRIDKSALKKEWR